MRRNSRRQAKRSKHYGRIYAIAGGRPNKPLVCLAADCMWTPEDDWSTWTTPQILTPRRGWFAIQDHTALADWIVEDRKAWQDENPIRQKMPVCIGIDASQSPAAVDNMSALEDERTLLEAFRLTSGMDSPLSARRTVAGQTIVGAQWLVSWTNSTICKGDPSDIRHGKPYEPNRVVLSFDEFASENPPGMSRAEWRSALSAAETLVKPNTRAAEADAALDLSADESVAATTMLAMLTASMLGPDESWSLKDRVHQWGGMNPADRRDAISRLSPI